MVVRRTVLLSEEAMGGAEQGLAVGGRAAQELMAGEWTHPPHLHHEEECRIRYR